MGSKSRKKKSRKKGKKKRGYSIIIWMIPLVVMAASVAVKLSSPGEGQLPRRGSFQMEVLNGTGERNLVKVTTRELRKIGIDVLIEGNAEEFDFRQSVIIDRKGDRKLAEMVAKRLGCETVIQQLQENPKVDLTFIVGDDKEKLDIDIMGED